MYNLDKNDFYYDKICIKNIRQKKTGFKEKILKIRELLSLWYL